MVSCLFCHSLMVSNDGYDQWPNWSCSIFNKHIQSLQSIWLAQVKALVHLSTCKPDLRLSTAEWMSNLICDTSDCVVILQCINYIKDHVHSKDTNVGSLAKILSKDKSLFQSTVSMCYFNYLVICTITSAKPRCVIWFKNSDCEGCSIWFILLSYNKYSSPLALWMGARSPWKRPLTLG